MARSLAHPTRPIAPIALALAVAPTLLLVVSVAAAGAQAPGTPATPANRPATPPTPASSLEQFAGLELTAAQRQSIDSLAAAARGAREALIAKRGDKAAGAQMPQAGANAAGGPTIGMSFSESERAELQRIATDFEAGLQRILTAAQREKLKAAREAMRQRYAAQAEAAAKEAHAKRPTKPPADLRAPSGAPATPPTAPTAPPVSAAPRA